MTFCYLYFSCQKCRVYVKKASPAANHFQRQHADCSVAVAPRAEGGSFMIPALSVAGVIGSGYTRAYCLVDELALAGRSAS